MTLIGERVSSLEGAASAWVNHFDDLNNKMDELNRTRWKMFITMMTRQIGGFIALTTLILRIGG